MNITKLFIDSRSRNHVDFPNSNRFRVYLQQPITNVRKIILGDAVIPNISGDIYPYVAVVTDLFLRGPIFPAAMQQYPAGTVGIIFNNIPTDKELYYSDEGDGFIWESEAPGGIPRLQELELSLMTHGGLAAPPILFPYVAYAPGKYPEWNCTLKIVSKNVWC